MQTALAKMFNKTAAEAYKAFPQELKKLVILLVPSSDTPVYVSPAIAGPLTKSTADIKKAVKELTKRMHTRHLIGNADRDYDLAGTTVSLITLNKNPEGPFSRRYTKEMDLFFTLDHEIGHHILKNGYSSSTVSEHLAESAADAFAALRHIQRFGKDTDHAGSYDEMVANFIVLFFDGKNYTSDSIERAFRIAEKTDISRLSLRATARLAEKIADECHLGDKRLGKIRNAYLPVYEVNKAHEADHLLIYRKTLSVMKKYRHDRDIFKAGKRFLSYPARQKFMTAAAKTDPYWKDALSFIKGTASRKGAALKSLGRSGP